MEGFEPGAEVHLVSVDREAHTLTVTDGHAQVVVPPDKLTNDTDIAAMVKAKDQANQAQIAAYQQAEAKAYQEYEKQAADYTAKDIEKRQQEQRDGQARAQEQANQNAQPVNASVNTNGYYNEGGFGYGTPYGYFANLSPTNVSGGGKGSISSAQGGNQSGNRTTGAGSSGASSGGGARTGGGGGKP